jgi:hypothetical protein
MKKQQVKDYLFPLQIFLFAMVPFSIWFFIFVCNHELYFLHAMMASSLFMNAKIANRKIRVTKDTVRFNDEQILKINESSIYQNYCFQQSLLINSNLKYISIFHYFYQKKSLQTLLFNRINPSFPDNKNITVVENSLKNYLLLAMLPFGLFFFIIVTFIGMNQQQIMILLVIYLSWAVISAYFNRSYILYNQTHFCIENKRLTAYTDIKFWQKNWYGSTIITLKDNTKVSYFRWFYPYKANQHFEEAFTSTNS